MRGPKGVVDTLRSLRESAETLFLAQRPNTISPTCQNFVGVTLVGNVPNYLVAWCVKNRVQRNRQLNNTKPSAKMSTGLRNSANRLFAQLMSNGR